MGIFKKIFGGLGKTETGLENQMPDIDQLLLMGEEDCIIELDNYLARLSEYGERLDLLNEEQKVFFYIQGLEREVNNGGFHQYFFNSSGDFAHETVSSLKTIKAFKTADIVQIAISQFPKATVPKDRAERHSVMDSIESEASVIWEELDQRFFAYEDNLLLLNVNFIRENIASFR